jgi:hypothetical protein
MTDLTNRMARMGSNKHAVHQAALLIAAHTPGVPMHAYRRRIIAAMRDTTLSQTVRDRLARIVRLTEQVQFNELTD